MRLLAGQGVLRVHIKQHAYPVGAAGFEVLADIVGGNTARSAYHARKGLEIGISIAIAHPPAVIVLTALAAYPACGMGAQLQPF